MLQPLTSSEAFLTIQGTGEGAPHAGCGGGGGVQLGGSAPDFLSNK